MLRHIFILLALFMMPLLSKAQNNEVQWAWSNTYGNANNSIANHLEIDDSSYMYIAGVFKGELIVQTDTINCSPTVDNVFVAKFDSLGTLMWITRIDWGYFVNQIRLDSNGDLRVLCNSGTMIVYNGITGNPITYYSLPNSIADSNSPTPYGQVIDFRLDENDNMYVLARYEDANSWENFSYLAVYSSPNDTISNVLWEDYINVGFIGPNGPSALDLDSSNNVYISGTTDFATLSHVGVDVVTTSGPGVQLFGVKYNTLGEVLWLTNQDMAFAEIVDMAVNTEDSSMYMTGYTVVEEVFYGDTLYMDTTNSQQIYLMKFDLDGNNEWSKTYPLETKSLKNYPGASWGATGSDLQISDSGYVYMKGSFTGSIIFYNDTLVEDTTSVVLGLIADDVFITKLDPNGNPLWGKYAGNMGGVGLETGDFYVDPASDILYLVGYWAAPNNLFKMATPTNSIKQIFLGKEGEPSTVDVAEIKAEKFTLLVYPNPTTGEFYLSKPTNIANINYHVLNIHGNVILSGILSEDKEMIDLTDFSSGMYFLRTDFGSTKLLKR